MLLIVLMEVFPSQTFAFRNAIIHRRWKPWHTNGGLPDFITPLLHRKNHTCGIWFPCINLRSKKSTFQDFQSFAEPSRLLPVTPVRFCSGLNLEEILSFSNFEMFSLYILQFSTSNHFDSSLVDSDAAILLSLIDLHGNSILQRISPGLMDDLHIEKETTNLQERRFQRGSVDTIAFQGSVMEQVAAIWIGLESGSWRIDSVRLIVINLKESPGLITASKDDQCSCREYDFEVDGILIGEGDGDSMIELRPKSVTDHPIDSTSSFFTTKFPTSTMNQTISRKESVKDYTNFKLSLLIYDAIIVTASAAAFSTSVSEKASSLFLFGGLCGFVFLLLLQKSVDGLSASTLTSDVGRKGITTVLGGLKGPLAKFALALAVAAVFVKYGQENNIVDVTPFEFLMGVLGFSTSRIAVLFAVFKPLEMEK